MSDLNSVCLGEITEQLQAAKDRAAIYIMVPLFQVFQRQGFELDVLCNAIATASYEVYGGQAHIHIEKAAEVAFDARTSDLQSV
jgi:hypothetical protein